MLDASVAGVIKIYDTQTIASRAVLLLLGARLCFLILPIDSAGAIYTGHVLLHISSPYAPWQANRAGSKTWR